MSKDEIRNQRCLFFYQIGTQEDHERRKKGLFIRKLIQKSKRKKWHIIFPCDVPSKYRDDWNIFYDHENYTKIQYFYLLAEGRCGVRMVGCSLAKLVPNPDHLQKIQEAVSATHKATILATELLNLHLRKCLAEDPNQDFGYLFNGSWLLNAYNEVTHGKRKVKVESSLRDTRDKYMPAFQKPNRTGIQQCLLYDARNLATVAVTNVWFHFQPRMLSHVRTIGLI